MNHAIATVVVGAAVGRRGWALRTATLKGAGAHDTLFPIWALSRALHELIVAAEPHVRAAIRLGFWGALGDTATAHVAPPSLSVVPPAGGAIGALAVAVDERAAGGVEAAGGAGLLARVGGLTTLVVLAGQRGAFGAAHLHDLAATVFEAAAYALGMREGRAAAGLGAHLVGAAAAADGG